MNRQTIKLLILMLIFTAFSLKSLAQNLKFRIDTLKISNIVREEEPVLIMHYNDGPVVLLRVSIINNSDSIVILKPNLARYYLTFNYEGQDYKKELFPLPFTDNLSIILKPHQTTNFSCYDSIFLGTPLFSEQKLDFTYELLKAIPTLKFIYKQQNLAFNTSNIVYVELADFL